MSQETPADLKPEEGFRCKATSEVFKTYDESVERTTLCASAVWSCSLTKKPGLTYREAVDSERRALPATLLQSFPSVCPPFHVGPEHNLEKVCGLRSL